MDNQRKTNNPDHSYTLSHTHFSQVALIPLSANGPAPKIQRQYAGLITRTHIRAGWHESILSTVTLERLPARPETSVPSWEPKLPI